MIADNRLTELASWDDVRLGAELEELKSLDLDFAIEATGFEMSEIDLRIGVFRAPDEMKAEPQEILARGLLPAAARHALPPRPVGQSARTAEGRAQSRRGRGGGARRTVAVKQSGRRRRITKLEAAAKQLVNRAAGGDQRATQFVFALVQAKEGQAAGREAERLGEADAIVIAELVAVWGGGRHDRCYGS